jgi:hypothetical protein
MLTNPETYATGSWSMILSTERIVTARRSAGPPSAETTWMP